MEELEEFVALSSSSVPEGGYGGAGSCGQRAETPSQAIEERLFTALRAPKGQSGSVC